MNDHVYLNYVVLTRCFILIGCLESINYFEFLLLFFLFCRSKKHAKNIYFYYFLFINSTEAKDSLFKIVIYQQRCFKMHIE